MSTTQSPATEKHRKRRRSKGSKRSKMRRDTEW
jgi:hypothetical protein